MPQLYEDNPDGRHHSRKPTLPFARSTRQKPRRWPLVFRFIKGAIHAAIVLPVLLHALFAAVIVFIDQYLDGNLGLPASIIPSLSIVVGLMLVFRNQTSYNRFWDGRNHLTTVITSIRNLTRSFLVCSALSPSSPTSSTEHGHDNDQTPQHHHHPPPRAAPAETERVVKILLAILYATKNHLRAAWGAEITPGKGLDDEGHTTSTPEYADLLPSTFRGLDSGAVGLPLQLTYPIEAYIKRHADTGAFNAPQSSQLTAQLSGLVGAYGACETIRLTGIPVAHLIHQKQVLALFGCVLPFALVDEMGWWAVPIVVLVTFTLYGIDGIARQLEDPFGQDRNDIKVDDLVEDVREEAEGLLAEWKRVVFVEGEMFCTTTTTTTAGAAAGGGRKGGIGPPPERRGVGIGVNGR